MVSPDGVSICAVLLSYLSLSYADLDTGPSMNVSAVEHQSAELPCDVTPPSANDELRLVMWYYGTGGAPVYTYDVRGRPGARGAHWADSVVDTGRVRFHAQARPAHLRISDVRSSDQRAYRCRVDFLHSATRNSHVNLTVITPPGRPVIVDAAGHPLDRGSRRRYRQGEVVQLTCTSGGGNPPPNITWWRDNELLSQTTRPGAGGGVTATLTLGPLTRADLGRELTCWASNHVLAQPKSTTVTIDMLLRPERVRILGTNNALSAGRSYQLTCQTHGSRPAAVISWWKEGQQLTNTDQEHSHSGNVTTSRVTFVPEVGDSGLLVRCRAHNPLLTAAIEDVWRLNVRFAPVVQIKSWSSQQGRPVQEGHDVFMQCIVRADPPSLRIVWQRDGVPLVADPRRDIGVTNDTLSLRHVTASSSGDYTCAAYNQEGRGQSAVIRLRVRFPPRCDPDQTVQYGASRGETVYVRCNVMAEPAPFRFFWAFNASGHMIDMPESQVESTGWTSVCRYTPRTMLDFGNLLCWAENDEAAQLHPCVFHVLPADRPEALRNCSLVNSTSSSLHVQCRPGGSGGLQQLFVLELTDIQRQRLVTNITAQQPRFVARGLLPGRRYLLAVYAYNDKGRGDRFITTAVTPEDVAQKIIADDAKRPPPGAGQESSGSASDATLMTPLMGVLVGIIGVLVLLAVAALVGIRLRSRSRSKRRPGGGGDAGDANREINNQLEEDLKLKSSTETLPMEYLEPDEKHMIERLGAPGSCRSLRPAPDGYSGSGSHHSPCGSLVRPSALQHRPQQPPEPLRPEVQYASMARAALRTGSAEPRLPGLAGRASGSTGAAPHQPPEMQPFLPASAECRLCTPRGGGGTERARCCDGPDACAPHPERAERRGYARASERRRSRADHLESSV